MDSQQFIEWLKQESLFDAAEKQIPVFQKVLSDSLKVRSMEELVILGDTGYPQRRVSPLVLGSYLLAAKRMGLRYKFFTQEPKERGEEADDELVDALLNLPDQSVILWGLSGRIGSMDVLGQSFRKFVKKHRHRFASTPSLGFLQTKQYSSIVQAANVDYTKLREDALRLKERLDVASEVRVTTERGTDFIVDVRLKKALTNDGAFSEPGSGGNIPCGEVYLPPRKKGVNGKIVIDGCARMLQKSVLVKEPITLTVKEGEILSIEGGQEAKELEQSLQWAEQHAKYPWGVRRIGELGIGLNPYAKLVESTLISEKMLGTAHVAIGSNYWFGGTIYAIIHLDQVFMKPKISIDGERLVL